MLERGLIAGMDKFVFECVAVAGIGGGLVMAARPAWAVLHDRDHGDNRPVTAGEVWTMRLAGLFVLAGSCYGLYALLTGMPGAEFGAP